ncbi:uncharacterized protein METZ01_LOCUS303430, partial [marine metagenome]
PQRSESIGRCIRFPMTYYRKKVIGQRLAIRPSSNLSKRRARDILRRCRSN